MLKKGSGKEISARTQEWMGERPKLVESLERLREISEDQEAGVETLEEAERAVLEEIERLGRQALEGWLSSKERKASEGAAGEKRLRKHSKKNSG
jgi:hypothetical protein